MRSLSLLMAIFLMTVPLLAAQTADDGKIHDDVVAKLAADTDVRGGGFDVIVKNGMVTLKGQVHSQKAKEKAEKITKKVKGVVGVDNQLQIFGTSKLQPNTRSNAALTLLRISPISLNGIADHLRSSASSASL